MPDARHNRRLSLLAVLLGATLAFTSMAHAQAPPPSHNPYNAELARFIAELPNTSAPQAAVLLRRIYDLRDYVDDPAEITKAIAHIAGDPARHPLVRDEALHLLALIDLHEHRLQDARSKLAELGFVREWAIVGPFGTTQGLDARFGLEQGGFSADREYLDGSRRRSWRTVPDFGPNSWVDLANFYPHATPGVAFATTSLFVDAPRAVALRFSADSARALFVNGKQVFRDDSGPDAAFDQHAVAVELHAGWNSVLIKLYRTDQEHWRFGMRVTELDGGGVVLRASAVESTHKVACSRASRPPDDLVAMAQRTLDADPTPANLETLGRIEHDHSRRGWLQHFEAAAQREPTATRWLLVARSCEEPACKFSALNAALKTEPSNPAAALAMADYYTGRNQLEKARDLLRDALQHAPNNFVVRKRLADLFTSVGLSSLAMQECRRLATEFPKPLWLRRELASRYETAGLLDEAEVLLREILPQNWDSSRARSLLLHVYERRHDAQHLREVYTEAGELDPTDTQPLAQLALLAAGAGDLQTADAQVRSALSIAPDSDQLHQQYAEMLVAAGKPADAREELARALEIDPQLSDARRRLQALSGEHDGDPDERFVANVSQLAAEAHRAAPRNNANTTALADVRVERMYDNGQSSVRVQQVFYVANEQGVRELAKRTVQYTPDTQELEILHARVHKTDGRTIDAEDAGEANVAEPGAAMYYDVRARELRFRNVEPGNVIELDYRITPSTRTNAYGDYFADLVIFGSSQPEKLKRFVLITPERRQLNVLEQGMSATASITLENGHRTYVWEAHDLAALPNEPRAPAVTETAPYVNVSTFGSWGELGRWYAQLVQPQFALDRNLRDVLTRILAGTHSELDKVRAIHEFVLRNTHYVALEFGIYGFKPYPVTQTYARRFGDCKDKASLMIALLRAAGIDADIALVRTRRLGDISPRATSIAVFNHAVAYLPQYDLWLDGTAEYAGSRELPLDDQGAMALTVAADGQVQLRRIPTTTADQNYTRRTIQAQIQPNGAIQFSGSAYSRGEDAPGLRRQYEVAERQRDAFRDRLAEVFPSVRVEDVQVDGANDLEHDITVSFRGTLDTFTGRRSLSLAASWMPRTYVQTLAPLATRTQPLVLPAPWTTEEEIHFALPAGALVESKPANTAVDTPFGSATLRFEQRGREIVIRTTVQFRQLRISTSEYAAFRDFCDTVERAFRGEVKVRL